jgi:carboxymethylenebutenolidase
MTELQRYLAEEVAEDHADGIITRREAMRRLGLLGLSGAVASSLLATVPRAAEARHRHKRPKHSPTGASIEWAPVPTEAITFPGPGGITLLGAWAPAERPRGGILVIHENRGLNDHIRSVAGRPCGRRLLRAGPRPALRGGRHGRDRRRGAGRRNPRERPPPSGSTPTCRRR